MRLPDLLAWWRRVMEGVRILRGAPETPCDYGLHYVPGASDAEIAENLSQDRRFGGRGGYRLDDEEPSLWV